ncbi:MAG: hypothetical protein HS111_26965 [Kofleriaceae bacterium]|nr:hypothetical protein [Kofleriaceae bacterium]MCL4226378.1 hypothetical protein [Myxococcales bacterium]
MAVPAARARLSRRPPPRPAPPPRKGMAGARRLSVFQRRVETGLSPTTLELVFEHMKVVSEGGLDGDLYAGSTMITIDLAALAPRLSDLADAATARRMAELAPDDPRVRARARAVAFAEARRLAGGTLVQPEIDLEVRARGPAVLFALNVEATLRR